MRVFANCSDMLNEVARDLAEMGVVRATQTMQDKFIAGDPGFMTKELLNYSFCITNPFKDLSRLFGNPGQDKRMYKWCCAEFLERISVAPKNPGKAWKHRLDLWDQFRNKHSGKFSYTYNERIRYQLDFIMERLKKDKYSRQAILSIWDPHIDPCRLGVERVPCSLYYHFMVDSNSPDGKVPALNVTYAMRSCDFITHMPNDVFLAIQLLRYVAGATQLGTGKFFMNISSLHYYKKDEADLDAFMRGERSE